MMAAIELAVIRLDMEKKLTKRQLKAQSPESTYAKICFDRQIVAISKANQAHTIYSEDSGVAAFATKLGIKVVQVWTLPKPRETQIPLAFMQSAPNVLYLPARSTSEEMDNDDQGNGIEAVEGQSDEAVTTGNGSVSEFPATNQSVSLSPEGGDNAPETNAPPA